MSHKYANASLIIPQVMALKATLSRPETKDMLFGIGATLTKLQAQMTTRFQPYLDNPNLMVSTYVDPRWKGVPFRKESADSTMSLSAVEEVIIERYMKHEKELQMYEEQKRKEEEEEEAKTYIVNKPPTQAASTPNDIVMVDEVSDNTVVKPISLSSIFESSVAQLFGEEDEDNIEEVAEEVMSPDEQQTRKMLAEEMKRYNKLKRIGKHEDPLEWWHMNARAFPYLKTVAAIYLSSPPSSVESERTFSIGGNIVTKDRTRLTSDNTEKLIFLNSNLPLLPLQDYSKC